MRTKKNSQSDLRNKSLLFFQLALIVVLFASWQAFEYKSYSNKDKIPDNYLPPEEDVIEIPITKIKNEELPKVKKYQQKIEQIPDEDDTVIEDVLKSTETNQDEVIVDVKDVIEEQDEDPIEDVILKLVSEVPVFPGCEYAITNDEKRKCMSAKINKFVKKKFDNGLAERLGLEGRQRITVQFKIDTKGNIVDVRARAPHAALKKEAEKVVNQLPVMKAGKHNGKPVRVLYTLPIVFQVLD